MHGLSDYHCLTQLLNSVAVNGTAALSSPSLFVPSGNGKFDITIFSQFYWNFFSPMPPHVLMNFRGFPPGCGDSVADF